MKITNIALEHKVSIFILVVIIIIGGFVAYINLPKESFPEIELPMVFISASYLGVAPSDMETLVVQPIEDKLKEIAKIENLTSITREGYTSIIAEFGPDIEIDEAVRKIREKVDQAKPDLPGDMEDPIVQEINTENIPVMIVSIVGEQSLVRLKRLAEDIQEKIEDIPGILSVDVSGGLERELKINVYPARLISYDIGVDTVISAISDENLTIPGGSTESSDLKWTVRVPGEFTSAEELKNIVVTTMNSYPIYLYDVADVEFGFKEQESYSRLNGKPTVTLSIQKRSGENIIRITDAVKEILKAEKEDFPSNTDYYIVTDFSEDIRIMVSDLENNIIAGLLLVVGVLYFFMGARNGLLVGIAIPLSMLISFAVISLLGFTLNFVVLASLILSLGMLVDNAIVIVENIYRQHHEGKPLLKAAREATAEVGSAVVVSTLTTLMAFLPLAFWKGIIGEFMRYLPITLIVTLSSSLLVGLVFNPVISSSFLKLDKRINRLPGDRFLQWLLIRYEKVLGWVLQDSRHRWRTLGLTAGAFVVMMTAYLFLNHGTEFFPDMDPSQIIVEVEAPLGTKLTTSNGLVREIESRIKGTPDMDDYVADVGGSSDIFDFGTGGGSSHKSQVTIDLVDQKDRSQSSFITLDQVEGMIGSLPGARVDVTRVEDGPPTGKAVEVQVKGEDFGVLSKISDEILARLEDVPGISKLEDDYEKGRPELRIRIDREKAALLGLNTSIIASTIRTAINGAKASELRMGTEEYDITVRYSRDYRTSYTDLLNLTVFHEGIHYPLANFATVELATGLSSVNRVDGERVNRVTADAIGRSSAEVLSESKKRLEGLSLPEGYSVSYAGQDEEQRESIEFLMRAFMVAVLLIFLLLVTQFNSLTLPFVIMITVFLSFFGVFFGLLVSFKPFGIIMTGIGIISLAGVVVNNAIVLIDYIQKLRARGLQKLEAIIQGGKTRLRPVLLTATTTILGLIPLTTGITIDFIGVFKGNFRNFIQFGAESSEWWSGIGVVVIFGLLFATVLTLVVVPVMYYIMSDFLSDLAGMLKIKKKRVSHS